ncbi:hypothetical protein NCCP1664_01210 [Zafaria cholistanensis]|uniref:TadE-like domain-containing protein n=1 Tax=Zafaria cholistanensis TaxID=1682741 RepID=A0A5A7NKZ1_9MICC|nr:hypothetical protein NCCP1664_01210 [Zafaria cholistanensis]
MGERGASAVEMALLLPILVTLVFGIIEFGYAFNQQISLSQAAREGARYYAIHSGSSTYSATQLTQTAQAAAPMATGLSATASATCTPGALVTVTTQRSYASLTGWFDFLGPAITLSGKAAMRCGG